MDAARANGIVLHYRLEGPEDGLPVVFANSLGTDFRVWDRLIPRLPAGLRVLRYDKRGHGLSEFAHSRGGMATHVADLAGLMDHLGLADAIVVGLSVGGVIAQGLAASRPDLVRALALCDTAAKIGSAQMWDDRIAAIRSGGIEAMAEPILERWFSRSFPDERPEEFALWRAMLCRTNVDGYLDVCAALAETDYTEATAALRLPAVALVGDADGSTPPELARATAELIPGARFEIVAGAGHLPCIEQPDRVAEILGAFIEENGLG